MSFGGDNVNHNAGNAAANALHHGIQRDNQLWDYFQHTAGPAYAGLLGQLMSAAGISPYSVNQGAPMPTYGGTPGINPNPQAQAGVQMAQQGAQAAQAHQGAGPLGTLVHAGVQAATGNPIGAGLTAAFGQHQPGYAQFIGPALGNGGPATAPMNPTGALKSQAQQAPGVGQMAAGVSQGSAPPGSAAPQAAAAPAPPRPFPGASPGTPTGYTPQQQMQLAMGQEQVQHQMQGASQAGFHDLTNRAGGNLNNSLATGLQSQLAQHTDQAMGNLQRDVQMGGIDQQNKNLGMIMQALGMGMPAGLGSPGNQIGAGGAFTGLYGASKPPVGGGLFK